jgi:heme exporter protein A
MSATIEVKHLVKRFDHKAVLRELDFAASPGEFISVVGPNGAGKSTFLRILATLLRPSKGLVQVAGFRLPSQAALARKCLGAVTHNPLLYSGLTAEENLRFYCNLYGVPSRDKRIADVLKQVGLTKQRRDLVQIFSHGMLQRLAIARSILHDPEILLLDEPYSGLDQDACAMLDDVLREISADKRTVVMASHDLSHASAIASRLDVLSHGLICASIDSTKLSTIDLLSFYRDAVGSQGIS